jgi:tRNA C32,U32 (ribose-2'-O)-methylase TrmJ
MNLSHAVAATLQVVALSCLEEKAPRTAPADSDKAGPQRREALLATWLSALEGAGYFRSQTRQGFTPRLRALLERMALNLEDTALLEGMLRILGRREDAKP